LSKEDQTKVTCRTTKPIAICIFIAPSGATFDTKASIKEGGRVSFINSDTECGVKINPFRKDDAGEWRCNITVITNNFMTRNGTATTELIAAASTVTKDDSKWEGRGGGEAQFLCVSSLRISHCFFITPSGSTLRLKPGMSYEDGRIAFLGSDSTSECGVKLKTVKEKDVGEWRCLMTALTADLEVRNTSRGSVLTLEGAGSSLSSLSVAITVSVVLVIVAIITLVVCCKRKSTPLQNKEDSLDKNSGETWVVDNVQDTSAERSREQTNYFDPSYDYMG